MSDQCVVAQYNDPSHFLTAIEVLEKAGFTTDEVSVVRKRSDVREAISANVKDSTSDSPPTGATTAGATVAGGAIGAALGTATMIGPMLVVGPIAGMVAGAAGGGMASAVESWGIQHGVASRYERAVQEGDDLIIVSGDSVLINQAQRLLHTVSYKSLERYESE